MLDPVMRASGLRAVAVATVVGLVVAVLRFALLIGPAGTFVDADLVRASIGLAATTVGLLWIWGTVRAARGDDGAGGGLFALAATVAGAAVVLDAFVTLAPLVDTRALGPDAVATPASAARICWIAAQIALVVAVARLGWQQRRGVAMFGAAVALVVSGPLLVFDPIALALERTSSSLAAAWWLGTVPALLVGTGIVIATWGLPVPIAPVWRAFGRCLELTRAALAGIVVVAAAYVAVLFLGDADPVRLGAVLTGPLALLGIAAAIGAFRTSQRSIRWTRWSFAASGLVILLLVGVQIVVGALVPLQVVALAPHEIALIEMVGPGLAVAALALLVLACARVDAALRAPALAAGIVLFAATAAGIATVVLHEHAIVQDVGPQLVVASAALLVVATIVMAVRLLGKGVAVAEARAYGERVRAAQRAAREARLVHERWRAAKTRALAGT